MIGSSENDRWPAAAGVNVAALRGALEVQLADLGSGPVPRTPPAVSDHSLLALIGAGAYGDVWVARSALGRLRAVKIVYRCRFKEERPFEREFHGILKYEPVSRTHEGLVQVLHVGRNDDSGCFYYVMELADDAQAGAELTPHSSHSSEPPAHYVPKTLHTELQSRGAFPPVEAAEMARRLAGALGHLHARGLVHRDIKPGNVIFVQGRPKLADIGLVTDAGESRSFVGTEGFIPPEGPGTPEADLYGLGKLLYEVVTGRDRMDFPQLPDALSEMPECDQLLELNEILGRACAPSPRQRYRNASELEADLNLFLAGRSLRRTRATEQALVRLERIGLAAVLVLVLAIVAVWIAGREQRQAEARAQTEFSLHARAEAAERQSRRELYRALLEQARATVRSGEMGQRFRALEALRKAASITNSPELRCEALAAMALPDLRLERELTLAPAAVSQPDPFFERLAVGRGIGPLQIQSLQTGKQLAVLPASTNRAATQGIWSKDGRFLAVRRDAQPGRATVEIWETASARRALLLLETDSGVVSFHPSAPLALAGLRAGAVAIWELDNGKELARFELSASPYLLKFSPDGERFAAVYNSTDATVISVHSATDGHPVQTWRFAEPSGDLDWHPDGGQLAVADYSGWVHLLDTRTGERHALGRHKAQAVMTTFDPGGDYLITAGWEREMICWDLRTLQRGFGIGLDSFVGTFSLDGRRYASRSPASLRLAEFERPTGHRDLPEELGGRLRRAAFSPDGRWLAVPGQQRLGIWDLTAGGPAALATEGADARVFFSADSTELFASRDNGSTRWRVTGSRIPGGAPTLTPLEAPAPNGWSALCQVSNQVALTTTRGTWLTTVANLASSDGNWLRTAEGVNGASADGRWFAIFHPFSTLLYVYSLPGLAPVAILTNRASIGEFRFLPPANEVAVCSSRRVEFWSTVTWQRTRELTDFSGLLCAPDGKSWWLTRDYRNAGLYDARALQLLLPLPAGTLPLALSRDARYLAVSVDARRVQVWDLAAVRKQLKELGLDWEHGSDLVADLR
jgi:WD40 repeat protein